MYLHPTRNHRVSALEYSLLGAPNDSNFELICSSFSTPFPQPYLSCSKTCGSSLTAQTMLIKFKTPVPSVLGMHNSQSASKPPAFLHFLWSQTVRQQVNPGVCSPSTICIHATGGNPRPSYTVHMLFSMTLS